jgi:hypothetical protein
VCLALGGDNKSKSPSRYRRFLEPKGPWVRGKTKENVWICCFFIPPAGSTTLKSFACSSPLSFARPVVRVLGATVRSTDDPLNLRPSWRVECGVATPTAADVRLAHASIRHIDGAQR